jgi:hypothetical protein
MTFQEHVIPLNQSVIISEFMLSNHSLYPLKEQSSLSSRRGWWLEKLFQQDGIWSHWDQPKLCKICCINQYSRSISITIGTRHAVRLYRHPKQKIWVAIMLVDFYQWFMSLDCCDRFPVLFTLRSLIFTWPHLKKWHILSKCIIFLKVTSYSDSIATCLPNSCSRCTLWAWYPFFLLNNERKEMKRE